MEETAATHTPFGTEEKIEPWEGSLVTGYSDLHSTSEPDPNTKTIQRGRYAVHNWKNIKQTYKNLFFFQKEKDIKIICHFFKKKDITTMLISIKKKKTCCASCIHQTRRIYVRADPYAYMQHLKEKC